MTAFLLDMDGVLYHGKKVLQGALEFVEQVSQHQYLFVTNNPTRSPAQVADRLSRMGFSDVYAEQVLTSADAAALWLRQQKPGFRYFAIGAKALHETLAKAGTEDPQQADFVVVGEGPGLDYEKLTLGINLVLSRKARLVATNPDSSVDSWCKGEAQVLPGGGALVAPFEVATGQKAVVIGKPHRFLYEMATERLGVSPGDCIMVGDRPDTDVAGAAAMGMKTALVRTGRFLPGSSWPKGIARADWDVETLIELQAAFKVAGIFR